MGVCVRFVASRFAPNVKITGHMAGLRGSDRERGWQLECRLAECKELSGGEDTAKQIYRCRREFFTGAGVWKVQDMCSGASPC